MAHFQDIITTTPEQESALGDILWVACALYNGMLAHRRERWQESRHGVTYYEQAALWRDWCNEDPDENPLKLLNMTAGQQVLRRLDSAFKAFFQGKRGFPRFKKAGRFNSVNYKPGDGAGVRGRKLYVQNAGLITVRWHRELPDGKLKNIILLRKPSGWYACLQLEQPEPEPQPHPGPAVGIDMGLLHALTLSDGVTFDSPKYLRASLAKLRRLNRNAARQRRGSNRWRKTYRQIARLQEHIANQRRDWWHKTTHRLVTDYGTIVLEDLSLTFMLRNGNGPARHALSRSAHDVSLGLFRELLDYKAIEAGVEIVTVNPAYTSQACSGCGCIVPKELSVRVHSCPDCGLTLDRDVNAALNILSAGTRRSDVNVGECVMRSPRSSPL